MFLWYNRGEEKQQSKMTSGPTPGQKTIFLHELYQRPLARPGQQRVVDVVPWVGAPRHLGGRWSVFSQELITGARRLVQALSKISRQSIWPSLKTSGQRLQEVWERWRWQKQSTGHRYGLIELIAVFTLALTVSYVGVNYQALLVRTGYWLGGEQRRAEAAQLEQHITQDEVRLSYIPRSTKLAAVAIPVAPSDDRLIIPRLGINVPVVDAVGLDNKDVMRDLETGVVHLPNTAYPGQVGNVFITGHSSYYPWAAGHYKSVFVLLDKLQPGDKIALYRQGEKFIYQVASQRVVAVDDVSVLTQRSDQRKLTLMTCYPVGTNSQRLVIDAYQSNGQAA